jgi:hypothetical protein
LQEFWDPSLRAWPAGLAGGLLGLALYVATASPYVDLADPAQFQTLARTGGIAHAGYPTLVLLLQLFAHLPFGTLAWRANVLTCICGALVVGLLAYTATRLTRRPALAVIAALAFACSHTMWKEATLAGVHALTLAIDAAIVLLALRWSLRPSVGLAALIGLLFGIGLTSHLTVLGVGFPLAFLIADAAWRRVLRPAHLAAAALALVVGLTPFAYSVACDRPDQPMNYLRDSFERSDGDFFVDRPTLVQRVQRLQWLLSGRQYFRGNTADPSLWQQRALHLGLSEELNEFPFVSLPLAVIGLALLFARRDRVAGTLAAWFAGALVFTAIGSSPLTGRWFFLPGAWLLGAGLAVVAARLAKRNAALGAAVACLALAMPLVRLATPTLPSFLPQRAMTNAIWSAWPHEWSPLHADRRYDAFGREAMRRLPPNATILARNWNVATPLRYFVWGEPLRPDVQVLYASSGERMRRHMRDAEAAGRPVFSTQQPAPDELPGGSAELVFRTEWAELWRLHSPAAAPVSE